MSSLLPLLGFLTMIAPLHVGSPQAEARGERSLALMLQPGFYA